MRYSDFLKRLPVALLLFALLISFSAPAITARAEDLTSGQEQQKESQPIPEENKVQPVRVTVPVSVTMVPQIPGAELPGEDTFPVTITPVTEGAAGPHSTIIVCKNTGSADLIFGDFTEPGEYQYQVTIEKSSLTNWIVDDAESVYLVTIVVTENEDGTLSASYVGDAPAAVKTYLAPLKIDVEVKWPDGGERPVTVRLYETVGDQKVEAGKVTVAATTDWKATFTHNSTTGLRLHPQGKYTVEEMELYKFAERYDYNKSDALNWKVTITNEKALPQTGPRTAVIDTLFLAGMLCLAGGMILLRKQKTYE